MKLISHIAVTALALLLVSNFMTGIHIDGLYAALIAAVILGIFNGIVRPILIILTFPITILTLGLFILVINASLFYFASTFIQGFSVNSFTSAFIGALIVSIISLIGQKFI